MSDRNDDILAILLWHFVCKKMGDESPHPEIPRKLFWNVSKLESDSLSISIPDMKAILYLFVCFKATFVKINQCQRESGTSLTVEWSEIGIKIVMAPTVNPIIKIRDMKLVTAKNFK